MKKLITKYYDNWFQLGFHDDDIDFPYVAGLVNDSGISGIVCCFHPPNIYDPNFILCRFCGLSAIYLSIIDEPKRWKNVK